MNNNLKNQESYYIEQILLLLQQLDETQLQYVNAFLRERFSMVN